jgi:hypothetical protein
VRNFIAVLKKRRVPHEVSMKNTKRWLAVALIAATAGRSTALERQITSTPKNHDLDNNDNFSPSGQWLCYDTRETTAPASTTAPPSRP